MKKVFIGTVSSNATVSAYYTSSIFNSQKLLKENGIECYLDIIVNEPLIQLARNNILSLFIESDCDELVFIDSDQAWNAEDLLKLINIDKDFVGAPVIFKNSNKYNVSFTEIFEEDLVKVDSVGTGFLKISKKVAKAVSDLSKEYIDGEELKKMAFEVKIFNGNMLSEDFVFCKKWKDLGGDIFIDPSIDPYHIGNATFRGNFKDYLQKQKEV
jgi:uncharacterized protein YlxP (DUF503 family)